MLGSALGDAIGELAFRFPEEGRLRAAIAAAHVLHYTDDTAMAIGLAESLAERGGLEPQHLGRTFHRHFNREPWRGYASGPPTIFQLVEKSGLTYEEAARNLYGGQGSLGNGAAMRVAPLGLFFHDAPDLYDQAVAAAALTHAHPLAQDGAAVQAAAVAMAVQASALGPPESSKRYADMWDFWQRFRFLPLDKFVRIHPAVDYQGLSDGDGRVYDWYTQAFSLTHYLFRMHPRMQFKNFCLTLREGRSLDDALRSAYRIQGLAGLDEDWHAWLRQPEKSRKVLPMHSRHPWTR